VAIHVINYRDGPAGSITPLKVVTFVVFYRVGANGRERDMGQQEEAFANRLSA
jgi:hypothetical protein